MIASERAPGFSPSAVFSRVSEPTRRNVTGSAPAGVAGDAGAGRSALSRSSKTPATRSMLPA
jgi:hypothetical protein